MAELEIPDSANIGNVDQRLVASAKLAARSFPYRVRVTPSGGANRRRGTKNHPKGRALDVQIFDANGKALPNLRNASSFRVYEAWAQSVYRAAQKVAPDIVPKMRFGGYFQQGVSYDQMHVDITGGSMALGSWEGGLNAAGKRGLPGAQSAGLGAGALPSTATAYASEGSSDPFGVGGFQASRTIAAKAVDDVVAEIAAGYPKSVASPVPNALAAKSIADLIARAVPFSPAKVVPFSPAAATCASPCRRPPE